MSRTPPHRIDAKRVGARVGVQGGHGVTYSPAYASPWPMIVGVAAVLASVGLLFVGVSVGKPTVLLPPWFALTLPQADAAYLGWVGYLLTPVIPICALVIDRVLQGRGLSNPQFIPRPWFGTTLKLAAALGIVVSLWHIITVAVPIVEWVQEFSS